MLMNAGVKDEHFINDERWNKTIAIVVVDSISGSTLERATL
jgi:hypothetical protein